MDSQPTISVQQGRHCALLVDMPNLNGHLRELVGGRTGGACRIDFQPLLDHLIARTCANDTVSATVFLQLPAQPQSVLGFITAMRTMGIGVYARPTGDIDDNLVEQVQDLATDLRELLLITHDRGLLDRCIAAVPTACPVTVLGLEEFATSAIRSPRVTFMDLAEIDGVLPRQLVRTALGRLPAGGALLPPLRALRRSQASEVAAA